MGKYILYILNILLLSAAVFTVCPYFTSSLLLSKWYFVAFVVMVGLPLWVGYCSFTKNLHSGSVYVAFENTVLAVCTAESLFLILQECGLVVKFGVLCTGTFDNVAGFASCVSFSWPLGLSHLKEKQTIGKSVIIAMKVICLLAIFLSGSRVGLLCVVMGTILILDVTKAKKTALLSLFALMVVCLAAFVKTDSSKGRYFIAARSLEMVGQHPIGGWGMNGFRKNYMSVQASYFETHPNSAFSMLADGVRHPLNEYLLILVDFGIIGLLAFCILAGLVIVYYIHHRWQQAKIGIVVFVEILLMAMFSYPSYYPFTWLMLLYSLLCIFRVYKVGKALSLIAVIVCFASVVPLVGGLVNELEWGSLNRRETYGLSRKTMRQYGELYKRMRCNAYFLYSYAVELFYADKLNDALRIALECRERLGADYDMELLLGDVYRQKKEYTLALSHYRQAHYMIPSRFIPLYGIYMAYEASGDTIHSDQMADRILHKAAKVESNEVNKIIKRVRERIDESDRD